MPARQADPFFDSFRQDYKDFDKWFNKKSDETAYVCLEKTAIAAFLYLKPEGKNENYGDAHLCSHRNAS